MLKILSTAKWDWAASGYFLSEAINGKTEHHSRAVREHESLLGLPYEMLGLTWRRIKSLWDWANVVHIHDAPAWDVMALPPKPVVVTFHGTKYRNAVLPYHKMAKERGWSSSVATPDLTRFGLPLLPDGRPDLSDRVVDKHDHFTVCHAPTKRSVKGTERVIEACKKAGVKLELIETEPWEKCIERKARCHVLVDQFELGFGCNAIEAWAMGMPVISDAEPQAEQAILKCFETLPYAKPEPTLEDAIARIRDDVGWRWGWKTIGIDHYNKWHSPEATAKIAVEFYERAIERRTTKLKRQGQMLPGVNLPPGELILVRYLGGNNAKQQWFPTGGTGAKYTFDANHPTRYVHELDVPFFLGVKQRNDKPMFELV